MPLVSMTGVLRHAAENGYAVGYFEAWNLESLLAVKDAAEAARSPVIIGFNGGFLGNPRRRVAEDIFVYGSLGRSVAEQSPVPMALILNESPDTSLLLDALKAGFNTIMHDHEGCSVGESTRINSLLVRAAHAAGAEVEAEIGELPMAEKGGGISGGCMTNPEEAERFVDETSVDALAVAIGNVHVLEGRKSRLDFELLDRLRTRIRVPLVLHGGTGVDPDDLRQAIKGGIRKINVGTALRRTFIDSLKGYFLEHEVDRLDPGAVTSVGGPLDMLAAARAAVAAEVQRLMKLFGSDGKAATIRQEG